MTVDATNIRTIANRYAAHLDSIEGAGTGGFQLRPGQMALARDIVDFLGEQREDGAPNTEGYFVRPTGTGKTVSLIDFIIGANTLPSGTSVLGDARRGKKALVIVPTNVLVDQWEDALLGAINEDGTRDPSMWGDIIRPEHVGIYRATDTPEQKLEALSRPIVVVTYDSARILANNPADRPQLHPEDYGLTLLDEVHDRPRGDVTGDFIRDQVFGNSLVIGATATHLYKSGRTIGDYLFGGQIPIHETTFREAVNRGEICPMRNVIAEVELDPEQQNEIQSIVNRAIARARRQNVELQDVDFTEEELEEIVEVSKRDEAAIRLLQRGHDPDTGKAYREMKQVWYCASIRHAEKLANQLNEEMGEDYAVAVHGDMTRGEQSAVILNYRQFNHHALTNCQLLTMGFDDKEAELCMQIAPTCSPIRSLQQGGRVMRVDPNNPEKIANIVTFVYPQIPGQVIFGELAGDLAMIPEGFEYGPTTGGAGSGDVRPWLNIEGLRVHYTTEQLTMFKEERDKQKYVDGLPVKPDDAFTLNEMAKFLFPNASAAKLQRETERLRRRIYQPLEDAYNIREARSQTVNLNTATDDRMTVSGQRFPVSHIGHYNHNGEEQFCIKEDAYPLCNYGMYGALDLRTPNLLSEVQARQLLGITDHERWQGVIDPLKEAYLDRPPHRQNIFLGENQIKIPIDHIGFFRTRSTTRPSEPRVDFHMQPDVLVPLYQQAHQCSDAEAQQWWDGNRTVNQLKASNWLTKAETEEALGITQVSAVKSDFDRKWDQIISRSRGLRVGESRETGITVEGRRQGRLQVAKKRTLQDDQIHLCVESRALDMIAHSIGLESNYVGRGGGGRRGGRG